MTTRTNSKKHEPNYVSAPKVLAAANIELHLPSRSTAPWDQPTNGTTITVDPKNREETAKRLVDLVAHSQTLKNDGRYSLLVSWTNKNYIPPSDDEPWYNFRGAFWTTDQKAAFIEKRKVK